MSPGGPLLCAALFDICLHVERIAGYRHDIQILAISVEPFLGDLRAVAHNGTRLDLELFFTEPEDPPDIGRLEKRFATTYVQLLHARIGKVAKSTLGPL